MEGEYLTVVDENDNVIGKEKRDVVHNKKLIHRAIAVFIFNKDGKILLAKRSRNKDLNHSQWQASVSGHVDYGEDYEEAAKREVYEEIGIKPKLKFLFLFKAYDEQQREHYSVYSGICDETIKLDPVEVEEYEFIDPKELMKEIKERKRKFRTTFVKIFEKYARS